MSDERFDENMERMIEQATPPLSEGLRARALEAMAEARPARWRRRACLAAVGLAAAALVAGIGFVPFPAGKAPGAWNRVLAATERMDSAHVAAFGWEKDKNGNRVEYFYDFWACGNDFHRREVWKDGELWQLRILDSPRVLTYHAYSPSADESYWPPVPAADCLKQPWHKAWEWWQALAVGAAPSYYSATGWTLVERRETRLWGGTVNIVEAQLDIPSKNGGRTPKFRRRWEIDPSTSLPLSIEGYTFEDQRWVKTYWTERIEWNVDVPEGLKDFEIPPGTTLTRWTYWKENADKVIATGGTARWQVALHVLEVDRTGRLFVGYSVRPICEGISSLDPKTAPDDVYAVDDTGVAYERYKRCGVVSGHWNKRVDPQAPPRPGATARTVTLYFYPGGREFPDLDKVVTLPDIPLPPRQDTDDVWSKYTEVIKY